MEQDEEGGSHQEGDGEVDDHGMGMALHKRKLLEEFLKPGGEMLQLLGQPCLEDPHLGIPFKDLRSVRGGRDLS